MPIYPPDLWVNVVDSKALFPRSVKKFVRRAFLFCFFNVRWKFLRSKFCLNKQKYARRTNKQGLRLILEQKDDHDCLTIMAIEIKTNLPINDGRKAIEHTLSMFRKQILTITSNMVSGGYPISSLLKFNFEQIYSAILV